MKSLWLIPILILIDQITKYLAIGRILLIYNFPLVLYRKNYGAAFSLFEDERMFLIIASIVVIGFLIYYYKRYRYLGFGFNLILAGSVSNLIDRIFRGYVIDFINIGVWPVFNLADAYNIIGVLTIILILKRKSIKKVLKKIKRE